MPVFVHRGKPFNKRLSSLRKSGGKASSVVEKAEQIMERLAASPETPPAWVHRHSRHGEARLERCWKFDLGSGYRLVYHRKGDHITFLYIGTHDDCDLWIKNHRGLQPEKNSATMLVAQDQASTGPETADADMEPEPDYDEILMSKIDEKLFRRIFTGLFKDRQPGEERVDERTAP